MQEIQKTQVQSLGWEDTREEDPLQDSWTPMDREAWQATVHQAAKSWTGCMQNWKWAKTAEEEDPAHLVSHFHRYTKITTIYRATIAEKIRIGRKDLLQ